MIYLDEAGISNPAHEPFVVMAGIIVHADQQWKSLERYLSDMADEFAPPDKRDGFIFHAKELFSGGKPFNREDFPKEKRWEILDYLVATPEKFEFGIAWGLVERAALAAKYPQWNRRGETAPFAQAIAFSVSSYRVELYMKYLADDDGVASLIV